MPINTSENNAAQWVLVSQSLPPLDTWVALWDTTNDYLPNMAQLVAWEGGYKWMACRTQWDVELFTHWLPLPPAPLSPPLPTK